MRNLSVFAVSALLAAHCFAAQSDFKPFMKAMVPKVEKAFETKDVAFFESISAPDFVDKSMGQTVKRKQAMSEMKAQMAMTQSLKLKMKLVSAEASGGIGHAVTAGSGTFKMKPGKDGKSHVMTAEFTERQTWVRTGATWKLKVLEETMGKTVLDGKPMPQGAAGH